MAAFRSGGLFGSIFVNVAAIPREPETLPQPKNALLALLAQSKSRAVREAMVLIREGHPRRIGPEYNSLLSSFAEVEWQPELAANRAASLAKAIARLRQLNA